jgi:hypothetical protein
MRINIWATAKSTKTLNCLNVLLLRHRALTSRSFKATILFSGLALKGAQTSARSLLQPLVYKFINNFAS